MALVKPARKDGQEDVEFVREVFVGKRLGLSSYSGMVTGVGRMLMQT